MSGMRKAARGLVETRREVFESRHGMDESRRRLDGAIGRLAVTTLRFTPAWKEEAGRVTLEAEFAPLPRTQRLLKALSIGMFLMVAASFWAMVAPQAGGAAYLMPILAVLAILGLPFLVLALASNREADESRIRKAIRVALLDEDRGQTT